MEKPAYKSGKFYKINRRYFNGNCDLEIDKYEDSNGIRQVTHYKFSVTRKNGLKRNNIHFYNIVRIKAGENKYYHNGDYIYLDFDDAKKIYNQLRKEIEGSYICTSYQLNEYKRTENGDQKTINDFLNHATVIIN